MKIGNLLKLLMSTFISIDICNVANAQTISTVAGGGSVFAEAVPATATYLRQTTSVTFDYHGNLLVGLTSGFRIMKVNALGIISTMAGTGVPGFSGDGGPATSAQFSPNSLATDDVGNIYFYDVINRRVRKIDTFGIITTVAGNGGFGMSGDGGAATDASVQCNGIGVDGAGNIYIAPSNTIRKVDVGTGIITTIAGTGGGGYLGDGGPATAAEFGTIRDVEADRAGNVYTVDHTYGVVRKIDLAGIVHTVAGNGINGFGGDGGSATAAQLNLPESVFADEAGVIYIADRFNSRIRKVDGLGRITTIAGDGINGFMGDGGPATGARFYYTTSVVKHGAGNIYIADRNNDRVRMITDTNHAVHFVGGHMLHYNVCAASVGIDTLLAATDTDTGQVDRWQPVDGPYHGTMSSTYVTYTTGSAMLPTGLTYTPTPGYVGYDTFRVRVTDGYTADTTIVYVRIDTALPYAAVIAGADSICAMMGTATLTDSTAGGVWLSATGYTSISAGGVVTGLMPGIDTIRYVVSNGCGSDTPLHIMKVKPCPDGVATTAGGGSSALSVYPDPNGGVFTIALASAGNEAMQIVITNVLGQIVKEVTGATNRETTVQLDVADGLYFVTAATATGRWVQKVVVR